MAIICDGCKTKSTLDWAKGEWGKALNEGWREVGVKGETILCPTCLKTMDPKIYA